MFGTPVPQVELCRCLWRAVFHTDAEMFFAAEPSPARSEIMFFKMCPSLILTQSLPMSFSIHPPKFHMEPDK